MESSELTVAYLQLNLVWEDWQANVARIDQLLESLEQNIDLILLPEMFGSGFSIEPSRVAQSMSGPVVSWMSELANDRQCHCMGSQVIEDDGHYYNRLINAGPGGTISYYDKRHLFSYAGEHENYTAGNHRLIDTINGWKVCPLVCYDLRFPVWSRNDLDYDLLLYVANWPKPRVEAWRALLKARAIENQAYVIGVNRIGIDPLSNEYVGSSSVLDMAGNIMHQSGAEEELKIIQLQKEPLHLFRSEYNFLADRDSYTIQ